MVEVLEAGEDFVILRSSESEKLYAVVLKVSRKGEEISAGPLAAWLSRGNVKMSAGAADEPKAKPKPKPKPRVSNQSLGSERAQQLIRLLGEHGPMSVPELNEKIGRPTNDTGIYSTVRSLNNNGLIHVREEPRIAEDGRRRPIRVYSVPAQNPTPIGPESSQRESEPSQGSSNAGL